MADMVPESYYSANYGKWHLGDEVIKRKGFDRWVPTEDVYRAYYSDPKYLSIFSDYHHFLGGQRIRTRSALQPHRGFYR